MRGLFLIAMLLSACETTTGSKLVYVSALPELKAYNEAFVLELADWLEQQPEGFAPTEFAKDHMVLREQIRGSKAVIEKDGERG